jgi:DNA-binding transcriptional ArsR family regulator
MVTQGSAGREGTLAAERRPLSPGEELALSTTSTVSTRPRAGRAPAKAVTVKVSDRTLRNLSQVFQMLADPSRLKILMALAQTGEMHVTALCDLLQQSQPAVSHHLRLLRMWGLVSFRRTGKHNFYRVDSAFVSDLLEQFFRESGNGVRQLEFADFYLAYSRK